jgi:hypothetical protein
VISTPENEALKAARLGARYEAMVKKSRNRRKEILGLKKALAREKEFSDYMFKKFVDLRDNPPKFPEKMKGSFFQSVVTFWTSFFKKTQNRGNT